jgi:3-oxoacyl-[acyl-carrier protein] reductase
VTSYNPLQLTGRLCVVTGASSGIGRATAVVLSKLGARVVLSGRRADALEETRASMERPEEHLSEPFDLSDVDAIPEWLKAVRARAGEPLHGLVHSAGMGGSSSIRAMNRRNIDHLLVPNLHASLMLLRGFSAKGVVGEAGAIVMLSSAAAFVGTKGLVVYGGSKGALHSIAKSAAEELGPKRIRVNCVAPGYVETPMLAQAQDELPGQFEHLQKQFLGVISSEDVGVACAYLLSDAAKSVTGTVLTIDGGYTL